MNLTTPGQSEKSRRINSPSRLPLCLNSAVLWTCCFGKLSTPSKRKKTQFIPEAYKKFYDSFFCGEWDDERRWMYVRRELFSFPRFVLLCSEQKGIKFRKKSTQLSIFHSLSIKQHGNLILSSSFSLACWTKKKGKAIVFFLAFPVSSRNIVSHLTFVLLLLKVFLGLLRWTVHGTLEGSTINWLTLHTGRRTLATVIDSDQALLLFFFRP